MPDAGGRGTILPPRVLYPACLAIGRATLLLPVARPSLLTLASLALRGTSDGATMTIEALVGFVLVPSLILSGQGSSYVNPSHKPAKSVHKKHNTRRYEHPSSGVPGSIGVGICGIPAPRF